MDFLVLIFALSIYFLFNLIIAVSWLATNKYKHKIVVAIVLVLFGLPIMVVVVTATIILSVKEVIKHEVD